ncbi:Retrovirus-related Pol polyprotein from transposon TNT 1-94 [Podosphaera aphanis]|nr:Retrovirus-related Pol polyprotein from transposon TNT 1-94 [Podosphaera aphanis]
MMQEKVRQNGRRRTKQEKKKSNTIATNDSAEDTQEGIWIMEEHALVSDESIRNSDVVLDTGATNHIFHDKSLFHSMTTTSKSVNTASGHSIPVSGVGNVRFEIYDYRGGRSRKTIEMNNVWYVPSCTRNLVSGMQLVSKGFNICSSNGGVSVLSSTNDVIATARPKGGLFCFNTAPGAHAIRSKSLSNALITQDEVRGTTELLHHRFAHAGSHLLEKINVSETSILKPRLAQEFRIDKQALQSCDTCNPCKQVEKINRGPISASPKVLELIHSDTWGRCRTPGIFNSLYFITFTDDCSRESSVYLMKNKSDVPHYFNMYREKKELCSGQKIKAMRFDGGTEYKTIDFKGISQQISAPYTQHQNGVAERMNRSLITMARCMLSHARLPFRFWDTAVLTACYLRNRLPSLKGSLTPFEVMNGRIPKVSHLKVFGCVCYALIDTNDPQRYKLGPNSRKGIFVGYCESTTQYQVYIPSKPGTNKVIISSNVRFMEESFWNWSESLSQTPLVPSMNSVGNPISRVGDASNRENEDQPEERMGELSEEGQIRPGDECDDFSTPVEEAESTPEEVESVLPDTETVDEPGDIVVQQDSVPDEPILRRSGRTRKPIEPRSAWQPRPHALHVEKGIIIPKNFSDAISGADSVKWQAAIDDELNSLKSKNVFVPMTHVPHGRRTVGSRWIFTIKSDGRFKARLVAQGYSQVYGIDYFDTYSPTLRMDSLRILLAVAAYHDWVVHQIDVKTAYLKGELEEEVFMRSPEGMAGTKFVRVNKALYGLKQSGRAWYKKLDEKLTSLKFKRSSSDQCIYIHSRMQLVIGVYVDDLVICGKILKRVVEVKRQLSSFFPIKDLGEIDVIIGWKITRERATRSLEISQARYISDKIRSFGLQDAKAYTSPLEGYDGILPGREDEPLANESAYASAIGSLGYASNGTRPDISFAVSQLGSYNARPVVRHWNSACRVFRYLKGTADYSISYSFGPISAEPTQEVRATVYSDSDFASDVVTRRSVSGYVVMIGDGPVCWRSKRQKSVSTSSAEAKYVALSEAAKQATWVSRLLNELHVADKLVDNQGLLTFSDNQSALSIAGGTNSAKTKHIDIAYHYVRECVDNKVMNVKYIPTDRMLADILTKPLTHPKAKPICQKLFRTEEA